MRVHSALATGNVEITVAATTTLPGIYGACVAVLAVMERPW
jgi:hypothetical protein